MDRLLDFTFRLGTVLRHGHVPLAPGVLQKKSTTQKTCTTRTKRRHSFHFTKLLTARVFARRKDFRRDKGGETTKETKDAKEKRVENGLARIGWPIKSPRSSGRAIADGIFAFCFRVFRVFRGSLHFLVPAADRAGLSVVVSLCLVAAEGRTGKSPDLDPSGE
jgi:hypothetical protein